jgi:septal ring factor EnvC (AmiA/AmiB activator)
MSNLHLRIAAVAAILALSLGAAAGLTAAEAQPSLSQLNDQLSREQARQQSLSGSIGALSHTIASLTRQITLVQSREAEVRADLRRDEAELAATKLALIRERRLLTRLRARLAWARMLLARQLTSSYERGSPDLVDVVLQARSFSDLLDQLTYLRDAEAQQQLIITVTRRAKAQADAAARRLAKLEVVERQITDATRIRARALAGMNALLQSKQAALSGARAAQQSALDASQARASGLRTQISRIEAAQAAARAAAAAAAARAAAQSAPAAATFGAGGGGGWVIPSSIVACESGGQNLPPNSAGASGYYQILPATWQQFGGAGPAAYLASRAEQNAVASRIWGGGSGASSWVCAGMVGIH